MRIARSGFYFHRPLGIFVLQERKQQEIHSQKNFNMATFILIHGSWHSSWNWHRVVPILRKRGHNPVAIDLPGMGKDKTPIQEVTLNYSVQHLCELINTFDEKIILLGHSKNGIMISQAAESLPHKIHKLIYLAAYLIPNGKTQAEYALLDTHGVLKPFVNRYPELNAHTLNPAIYKEGLYHDCDENIIELAKLLLSHESAITGKTSLKLTEENYGSVPRYYIECTEDRAVTPFIQQKMYSETKCKEVFKMNTSHSPFFSKPDELCDLLCEIASR